MSPIRLSKAASKTWQTVLPMCVCLLLIPVPGAAADVPSNGNTERYPVLQPSAMLKLPDFYQKHVSANGYPVVSSNSVNDYALKEAAYLVDMMLAQRPDIRRAMIAGGSRLVVMAHDEFTTDVPEHSHLKPRDYWDARA